MGRVLANCSPKVERQQLEPIQPLLDLKWPQDPFLSHNPTLWPHRQEKEGIWLFQYTKSLPDLTPFPHKILMIYADRRTCLGSPFDYTEGKDDPLLPAKAGKIYREFLQQVMKAKNLATFRFDWQKTLKENSLDEKYLAINFLAHGSLE